MVILVIFGILYPLSLSLLVMHDEEMIKRNIAERIQYVADSLNITPREYYLFAPNSFGCVKIFSLLFFQISTIYLPTYVRKIIQ